MGAFCAFVVGALAGWLGHHYRVKIRRVKDGVAAVVRKEI